MPTPDRKGLGLKTQHLLSDLAYHLRAALPDVVHPDHLETTAWPFFFPPLDQGSEGTCVGHGAKHWMLSAPVIQTKPDAEPKARTLYAEGYAIENPGKPVDYTEGLTLDAVCHALRDRGLIGEWRHTWEPRDAIGFVGGRDATGAKIGGPILLALPWDESMFQTDEEGILHPDGNLAGYHCVLGTKWDNKRGLLGGPNSWGRGFFGKRNRQTGIRDGWWHLSGEDLEKLFRRYGHGVAMFEQRLVTPKP